jgi:hypothetical protein
MRRRYLNLASEAENLFITCPSARPKSCDKIRDKTLPDMCLEWNQVISQSVQLPETAIPQRIDVTEIENVLQVASLNIAT